MCCIHRACCSLIPALFLIASLLAHHAGAAGGPFKNVFGKKDDKGGQATDNPNVRITVTPANVAPAGATGAREVLLITVPNRETSISSGSTIAFIDFRHIEFSIHDRPLFDEQTVVQEDGVGYFGESRVKTEIKTDFYTNAVCAAQVAYALSQHLSDLGRFSVVTRDNIQTVLEEQDFSNSASVNSTTAARLGEVLGADILVYGQVQLCVSTEKGLGEILAIASGFSQGEKGGFLNNIISAAQALRPEKLRSLILAQIQFIEAETGKQILTASLEGIYLEKRTSLDFDKTHRELVANAADDLANTFIDRFLGRPEPRTVKLYSSPAWDFSRGMDLIQLGDCAGAEEYFRSLYPERGGSLSDQDFPVFMYNHGVSLMCSNRSEEALDRLWASLRLSSNVATFELIEFTNELVDRGRKVLQEEDTVIRDVRDRLGTMPMSSPTSNDGMTPSASGAEGEP